MGVATASMTEVLSDDNAKLSIKAEVMGSDLIISQELVVSGDTSEYAVSTAILVLDKIPEEVKAQMDAGEEAGDWDSATSTFL